MKRRDVILAGAGVAALGLSEVLRPRNRLLLLQGGTIEQAMPTRFGDWYLEEAGELVGPALAGRVARALYSEMVAKLYVNDRSGDAIMILAAYGDTQSDLLQLHRPEYCYPAVGFNLTMSKPSTVSLGPGSTLPVRRVVAEMQDRKETIVYWTRMGEALPQSANEQRTTRLTTSMQGVIPDGILFRMSMGGEPEHAFATLDRFVPDFLRAVQPKFRKAFVGTKLAQQVA